MTSKKPGGHTLPLHNQGNALAVKVHQLLQEMKVLRQDGPCSPAVRLF
jgi:hypothetical protein